MSLKYLTMKNKAVIVSEICGFKKLESQILVTLDSEPFQEVKEISDFLGYNRTTVQKVLSSLYDRKLINRKQLNKNRGYCFVYHNLIDIIEYSLVLLYSEVQRKSRLLLNSFGKGQKSKDKDSDEDEELKQFNKDWLDFERDKL